MKNLLSVVALSSCAIGAAARAVGYSPKEWIMPYKRGETLQDIVSSCCGISEIARLIVWVGHLGRGLHLRQWRAHVLVQR
jgi:hypothetical protein